MGWSKGEEQGVERQVSGAQPLRKKVAWYEESWIAGYITYPGIRWHQDAVWEEDSWQGQCDALCDVLLGSPGS